MKICKKCEREKPLDDFRLRKHSKYPDGYRCAQCLECERAFCRVSATKYRNENLELCRQKDRDRNPGRKSYERGRNDYLKRTYGITLEEFHEMLAAQNGCCAICDIEMGPPGSGKGSACVDHDHVTGITRLILCHGCNLGLGNFKDSTELLERAMSYLSRFNT